MLRLSHRRALVALAFVASLIASLTLAGLSRGNHAGGFPEFSYPYTQKADGNCIKDPIDPINFLFKGDQASAANTWEQIYIHAGWSNSQGSAQNLRVNVPGAGYECHGMHDTYDQRASNCSVCSRFHIRLWRIPAADNPKKTAGDAHHEDTVCIGFACTSSCHAVDENGATGSGFDWGRRELRSEFRDGDGSEQIHAWDREYWGNTRNFAQCDANHPGAEDTCGSGA